ncbi:MAG: phosphodiester glycosidase family protein [Acutalibacteraceae bacterium]
MKRKNRLLCAALSVAAAMTLCVTASASLLTDVTEQTSSSLSDGASLCVSQAQSEHGVQVITTVVAQPQKGYGLVLGGTVAKKALVAEAAEAMRESGAAGEVVAGINGDHFSFQTGIPLGMSISQGRLLTNPIEPQDDEYYADALGLTADGTVLAGENPHLQMTYTLNGSTYAIDRINRTRESWEGGQLCLYTPDYGVSTGTNTTGIELIVRLGEGAVRAGTTAKGEVIAVNEDNDSPLEDGTVVLSAHAMRYDDLAASVGDTVEFSFSFEEEAWNDAVFAVGGNSILVKDGEIVERNYKTDTFAKVQPRSALGVREDGTLVLAAVDGRSEESHGLTANEMARYMAQDMQCRYAILLDGGGSTALCVTDGQGAFVNANTPSEERAVGNSVLLVRQPQAGGLSVPVLALIIGGVIVLAAVAAVVVVVLKYGRGNGKIAQ